MHTMKKFPLFTLLIAIIFLFSTFPVYAGQWVNVDTGTTQTWIDTSHYETRRVWVEDGYWDRVWVDTSHWETRTEQVWVKDGYYEDVWVVDVPGHYEEVEKQVWVPPVYETRTRTVYTTVTVYSYANISPTIARMRNAGWTFEGMQDNSYTTRDPITKKPITVYVIDLSFSKKETYQVKVKDGYYKTVKEPVWVPEQGHYEKVWVDTSHWETRTVQVWVKDGYWKDVWVDTSHYEYRQVWVQSGYWAPVNATVTVSKSPTYVYTKWHVDENKVPASMTATITVSNAKIDGYPASVTSIQAYHVINRYEGKGTETIYPASSSVNGGTGTFKFEYPHAGDKNSMLNFIITITNSKGTAKVRIYAPVPVNGFQTTGMVVDRDVTPQFDRSVLDSETISF
ncbi:MAG: hypothetical protein IMW83_03830 [Caldanaerobacter subterraneus]|nr:hypothetical protein [Caldanaerobacter subterraneus]